MILSWKEKVKITIVHKCWSAFPFHFLMETLCKRKEKSPNRSNTSSNAKDGKKPYVEKEEKLVNVVETPTPTLTRSTAQREQKFTFPIQPRFILVDLMKKDLLKPLEKSTG